MKNTFKDFGPIYVINLERQKDRLSYIKNEFKKHNITNYFIFKAIDASEENIREKNINKNIKISDNELACTMSHLSAIKHWLDTSSSEYAIIMEDDISFETVQYWSWTWKDFLKKVDNRFDVFQLCISSIRKINTSLHLKEFTDFSAVCYVIKRSWAEQLVKKHIDGEMFNIPEDRYYAVADTVIYNAGIVYSFPLFTYNLDFESSLNDRNYDFKAIHNFSQKQTLDFWKTKPTYIKKNKKIGGING